MPISWNPTTWIGSLVDQRMNAAGQAMVQVARMLVAVDTGELKSTIGYRYDASTRTLTLYAGTNHALPQEYGTYKMRPHPFLRPAMNVAGPAFLTGKLAGISTQIMAGTSISPTHKPRPIQPHIRPHIALANLTHNVGVTKRSNLIAVHTDRKGNPLYHNVGLRQTRKQILTSLSKLNKLRGPWN